eukprot:3608106-Karenia_brevis.AAC.1
MTISPSERHNGLAVRLSRYRKSDPLLHPSTAPEECKWIGPEKPSLEPAVDSNGDVVVEMPDYDLRRLIFARDPLCT